MQKQSLFLIFCLSLTLGLQQAYDVFRHHFSGVEELTEQVSQLKQSVEEEQLKRQIALNELERFKQDVASLFPEKKWPKDDAKKYQLRNLASVVLVPQDALKVDSIAMLMDKAKSEFRKQNFKNSIIILKALKEDYPLTKEAVEVRFLLAESYFLSNQYSQSVVVIDEMMLQFPDHNLTGFIMLRLAQIFQSQNRTDEAREVFNVIEKNFKNQQLLQQARKLSKGVNS